MTADILTPAEVARKAREQARQLRLEAEELRAQAARARLGLGEAVARAIAIRKRIAEERAGRIAGAADARQD